ncbi:MAG: histidinol-phosphate transaminase [Nitrospirota bacterium]
MDIRKFVRPNIVSLTAYEAREIPCRVKLDANESPYGFSRVHEAVRALKTNRYPDPEAKELRKLVARDLGIRPENILQGNGSDELISYLITTFGGPVLYPVPTFSMYGIISQALGVKHIGVPLDGEFDLDLKRMVSAFRKYRPKIIFLSSPNNPTGNCFSSERILKILDAAKSVSLVVVDEAYQVFAGNESFIRLIHEYGNLLVLRTLSKVGLAGLRVGFLVAGQEVIQEVNKIRLPFNLNSFSQAVACALLKNRRQLKHSVQSVVTERERLFRGLSKIRKITPFPSGANFILFRTSDPEMLYRELLRRGILIRNMHSAVDGCLRVTVGTKRENNIFLAELKRIMKGEEGAH